MDGLTESSILTGAEIDNLFVDDAQEQQEAPPANEEHEDSNESHEQQEQQETTEINLDTLFEESESVGSEDDNQEEEGAKSHKAGSSPYIYSSIAKALREDGILPDLEDDVVNGIKEPADFANMFKSQMQKQLDEQQQRVIQALDANVPTDTIRYHENVLKYLNSVTEESLTQEGKQAEETRKNIIYQDFINKGIKPEKAQQMTLRAVENGTDIDDAKEALNSNKEFFNTSYQKIIKDAQDAEEKIVKERKEQIDSLKKSILQDKNVFGDLELDKNTRQLIADNATKPVYKDPETGDMLTALQKYEAEHPAEFRKFTSLFYTLTDGFTKADNLFKGKVKKEVSKGLKELEHTLINTTGSSGGSLRFASGVDGGDSESFWKGFDLDV